MATQAAVTSGSNFCRDCGGPVTNKGEFAWCANTTPKAVCRNLVAAKRVHCEHCGNAVKHCRCGRAPLRP